MNMPESILQPIIDSDKEYTQIIKNLSPAVPSNSFQKQLRCLQTKYGLFSTEILDKKYTSEAKIDTALELYDTESSNFGWRCDLRFALNGFTLPDRKDMDNLLRLNAYHSDLFNFISSSPMKTEELGKIINLVYKELNNSNKMKQLKDITRSLLEEFSCIPLRKLSEDYNNERIERKIRQAEVEKQLKKGIGHRLKGYTPEKSNGLWSEN